MSQQWGSSQRNISASSQVTSRTNPVENLHPVPLHGTRQALVTQSPHHPTFTQKSSQKLANSGITPGLKWRTSAQALDRPNAHQHLNFEKLETKPDAVPQVIGGRYDPFDESTAATASEHRAKRVTTGPRLGNTLRVASQAPQLKSIESGKIQQATWLGSPTRPAQLGNSTAGQRKTSEQGLASAPSEIQLTAPLQTTNSSAKSSTEGIDQGYETRQQPSQPEMLMVPPRTELTPPDINARAITNLESRQIEIKRATQTNSGGISSGTTTLRELPTAGIQAIEASTQLTLPKVGGQQTVQDDKNPFPKAKVSGSEQKISGLRAKLAEDAENTEVGSEYGSGTDYLSTASFTCEEFRDRIASQTIDQISLDISPPFRPDEFDQRRHEELLNDFIEQQPIRTWSTNQGMILGEGRLIDIAYEKAVIELENGNKQLLPIGQLSEGDLAHINADWGLPRECRIEQVAYQPRQWAPAKVTWKASNLSHHPLYFESVNLERYGHTRGPLIEPVVQSAHFFGNLAILPYKMGVHGPRESQYALGYYRPGNEAPWIKQPLPISARGALAQAATMTGLFWLIP